jgi:hypothetical protein
MTRIPFELMIVAVVVLAFFGGGAISAQDKYTVQVPGGLAFSEFRGYEGWQVSLSERHARLGEAIRSPWPA